MNYLEQLAAEWYEYSGYFVRTNVRARKRKMGGIKNSMSWLLNQIYANWFILKLQVVLNQYQNTSTVLIRNLISGLMNTKKLLAQR